MTINRSALSKYDKIQCIAIKIRWLFQKFPKESLCTICTGLVFLWENKPKKYKRCVNQSHLQSTQILSNWLPPTYQCGPILDFEKNFQFWFLEKNKIWLIELLVWFWDNFLDFAKRLEPSLVACSWHSTKTSNSPKHVHMLMEWCINVRENWGRTQWEKGNLTSNKTWYKATSNEKTHFFPYWGVWWGSGGMIFLVSLWVKQPVCWLPAITKMLVHYPISSQFIS